jgi:hypothetical protein
MTARGVLVAAVGTLPDAGDRACVGLAHEADGYFVAFVAGDGAPLLARPLDGAELLAAVIAWFEESLTDPPPEIEATQEDLASAVRWLATTLDVASARGAELDRLLADALDAIDDGLAEDVVVRRLTAAATTMRGNINEQVDWVDLLVRRYRLLRGG